MLKQCLLAAGLLLTPLTAYSATANFDFTARVTAREGMGTIVGPLFDAFGGLTSGTAITGAVSYNPADPGAPSSVDNSFIQSGIGLSVIAPSFNTFMTAMTQVGSNTLRSLTEPLPGDVSHHQLQFASTYERTEPGLGSGETRFTATLYLTFEYQQRDLLYPGGTLPSDLSTLSWDNIILELITAEDSIGMPLEPAVPIGTGRLTADVTSIALANPPVAPVPVPATLPLLALALAGLGWRARRQRVS